MKNGRSQDVMKSLVQEGGEEESVGITGDCDDLRYAVAAVENEWPTDNALLNQVSQTQHCKTPLLSFHTSFLIFPHLS